MSDPIFASVPAYPRAARTAALVAIVDAVPAWNAADFRASVGRSVTPDVAAYLKPNAPEAVFVHAAYYDSRTTLSVFRTLAAYHFPESFVRAAITQFVGGRPEFPPYLAEALTLLYENEYASISRASLCAHGSTYAIQAVDKLIRHPLWNWVEFYSGLLLAGVPDVWRTDFAFMDLLNNRKNRTLIEVDRDVALYLFSSLRVMNVLGGKLAFAWTYVLNRHLAQNTDEGRDFCVYVSTVFTELGKLAPLPVSGISAATECPPTINWVGWEVKK